LTRKTKSKKAEPAQGMSNEEILEKLKERREKNSKDSIQAFKALLERPVEVPVGEWTFHVKPKAFGHMEMLTEHVRAIFEGVPDEADTQDRIEEAITRNFSSAIGHFIDLMIVLFSDGIPDEEPIWVKIDNRVTAKSAGEVRNYLKFHATPEHMQVLILLAISHSNIGSLLKNVKSLDMM